MSEDDGEEDPPPLPVRTTRSYQSLSSPSAVSSSSSFSAVASSSASSVPPRRSKVTTSLKQDANVARNLAAAKKKLPTRSLKRVYQTPESQQKNPKSFKLTTVAMNEKTSLCWKYFKKFDFKAHPDLKDCACCNICYKEAEADPNINFVVSYQVEFNVDSKS